jgi:hypothetical protein
MDANHPGWRPAAAARDWLPFPATHATVLTRRRDRPSVSRRANVRRPADPKRWLGIQTSEEPSWPAPPPSRPTRASRLHRHVLGLKEEALRRGWGEPAWLFPNDANRPYDKWKAGDAFRRTLKRAGLPHFRLYDLRHIYASLLLAAGAPIT